MNNKLIGIVLLVVGAIFIYMGVEASESFTSFWSKWWEGVPSDKSIHLKVVGGICCAAGGFFIWSSRKKT